MVKSLTSYGAFVDIGGVDGMIHVSELSWSRVKHPSEVVNIGDTVEVYIKEIDPGGYKEDPRKIIMGGPMMGLAMVDDSLPILKQNNAILAFNEKEAKLMEPLPCIPASCSRLGSASCPS